MWCYLMNSNPACSPASDELQPQTSSLTPLRPTHTFKPLLTPCEQFCWMPCITPVFFSLFFPICVFFFFFLLCRLWTCLDRMTKCDVKNYLEKIYNVPVGAIRTRIQFGECLHCFAQAHAESYYIYRTWSG